MAPVAPNSSIMCLPSMQMQAPDSTALPKAPMETKKKFLPTLFCKDCKMFAETGTHCHICRHSFEKFEPLDNPFTVLCNHCKKLVSFNACSKPEHATNLVQCENSNFKLCKHCLKTPRNCPNCENSVVISCGNPRCNIKFHSSPYNYRRLTCFSKWNLNNSSKKEQASKREREVDGLQQTPLGVGNHSLGVTASDVNAQQKDSQPISAVLPVQHLANDDSPIKQITIKCKNYNQLQALKESMKSAAYECSEIDSSFRAASFMVYSISIDQVDKFLATTGCKGEFKLQITRIYA